MHRRTTTTAALLLLAALLLPASAGERSITLARLDQDEITLEDLKRDFEGRHQGHMSMLGDEETVRQFLTAAIQRRLFVLEGRRLELDADADVVEAVAASRKKAMGQWLYETEVEAKATVSDDEIEAAMEALKEARHVTLIQVDSEEEARECHEALVGGTDPAELAVERSTADSRNHGGLERIFWGSKPPELEAAIFAVEDGGVSAPVRTDSGWVVTKVLAIVEAEINDPEGARARVEQTLMLRAVATRRDEYANELHGRYEVKVDDALLEPSALVPRLGGEASADDPPLAEYRGGEVRLSELVQGIRAQSYLQLSPGMQRISAQNLFADRLDQLLLSLEAERRWPEAPESVTSKVKWAEDELIHRVLLGRFVFDGLEVSAEESESWYADHREDYVVPPEIQLAVALLGTEEDAGRFIADLQLGQDFSKLAGERSLDPTSAPQGGVAGWVTPDKAIPQLREAPFELAVGQGGGPIQIEQGWLVYRVLDRRDERQLTLEQVRATVRDTLLDRKRDERVRQWNDKLQENARVRINDKGVRRAVELLAADHEERFGEGVPVAPSISGHGG